VRRSTDSTECVAPETCRVPWGPDWTVGEVIASLEPLVGDQRRERLARVLSQRIASVVMLLDAPHDPHNAAAVLRSCDAFGVQELHVLARVEPCLLSRRVARGTLGWVDVVEHTVTEAAIRHLAARGFELVAAHPEGDLVADELAKVPRLVVVLGNEHQGIHPTLRSACRRSVRVPMRGFVESLNVSVCAAILLSAATRGRAGDLDPTRQQELYARGLFRTVPRAGVVLKALKSAAGQRPTPPDGEGWKGPVT
jgi:tRNA (guanosine-2'-O-)-methyltransferase